jgi:hypothetical protein
MYFAKGHARKIAIRLVINKTGVRFFKKNSAVKSCPSMKPFTDASSYSSASLGTSGIPKTNRGRRQLNAPALLAVSAETRHL